MDRDSNFHIQQYEGDVKGKDKESKDRLEAKWGKKGQRPNDYLVARDGDSILIPFECDTCIFRKLRGTNPNVRSPTDKYLLSCIRRMNLDTFWSSSEGTVRGNRYKINKMLKFSQSVGLKGSFIHEGPLPPHDYCGYEVAVNMLLYSRNPGTRAGDHLQYDTIRKFQSTFGNFLRASPQSASRTMALLDNKGRYKCGGLLHLTLVPEVSQRV